VGHTHHLLVSVVLHIVFTMKLAARNRGARKVAYKQPRKDLKATYAGRTMVLSGPLLLAYIIFHIAHLTAPGLDLGGAHDHHDVYGNAIMGFRVWWVGGIYMFASGLLGLHLFHGAWSALQSMGLQHPRYDMLRQRIAIGLALFISLGNFAIPLTVLLRVTGTDAQLAESHQLTQAAQVAEQGDTLDSEDH